MTARLQPGSAEARAVYSVVTGQSATYTETSRDEDLLDLAASVVTHLIGLQPSLDVVFVAEDTGSHQRMADDLYRLVQGSDLTVHRRALRRPRSIQVRYRFDYRYVVAELTVLVEDRVTRQTVASLNSTFQTLVVRHRGSTWLDDLPMHQFGPKREWDADVPLEVLLAGAPS